MFVSMRGDMEAAAAGNKPDSELPDLLASYEYDRNAFAPLYAAVREKIKQYDPQNQFGTYLDGHLQRVRTDMEGFMLTLGYSARDAQKAGDAFALHDLGKILQDPLIWQLTKEKKDRSDYDKRERPKHTELGIKALEEIMDEIGFKPTFDQEQHLGVVKFLMLNHHERLNATGPRKMPGEHMDRILRIATIIDTVDGKMKTGKSYDAIFAEMLGEKHAGEFDAGLVRAYQTYVNSRQHTLSAEVPLALNRIS